MTIAVRTLRAILGIGLVVIGALSFGLWWAGL